MRAAADHTPVAPETLDQLLAPLLAPSDRRPRHGRRLTPVSWTIERHGRTAVVTMTTNPVSAQNREFFADLHDAFDRLESEHADAPVVLTGQRQRFGEHRALADLRLGERTAARASLFGEMFDQDQAYALGMFDELLPADQVLDRAVAVAESIPRRL